MPTEKDRRRRLVERLINQGGVASQEELRERLAQQGVEVAQATLSRDLRDLGVVKGPDGYTLPGRAAAGSPGAAREFDHAIATNVLSAGPATSLVVLRTRPAHAPTLAAAIDAAGHPGVVGTLAGDDAVFVALRDPSHSAAFLAAVRTLAGLE